jgi:hypothetical protein
VPSPTPMIGTLGDSTSVTLKPAGMRLRCLAAITPAVSQPAVPPPTTTIFLTGRTTGGYILKRAPTAYLRPGAKTSSIWLSKRPCVLIVSFVTFSASTNTLSWSVT